MNLVDRTSTLKFAEALGLPDTTTEIHLYADYKAPERVRVEATFYLTSKQAAALSEWVTITRY